MFTYNSKTISSYQTKYREILTFTPLNGVNFCDMAFNKRLDLVRLCPDCLKAKVYQVNNRPQNLTKACSICLNQTCLLGHACNPIHINTALCVNEMNSANSMKMQNAVLFLLSNSIRRNCLNFKLIKIDQKAQKRKMWDCKCESHVFYVNSAIP